jgi:hypothetical protein
MRYTQSAAGVEIDQSLVSGQILDIHNLNAVLDL